MLNLTSKQPTNKGEQMMPPGNIIPHSISDMYKYNNINNKSDDVYNGE